MIITNRETPEIMESVIDMCTQRDAESKIGIGDYADAYRKDQIAEREQFRLNDTSSLDQVIQKLASQGHITSFCTAGYRCGRTGIKSWDFSKVERRDVSVNSMQCSPSKSGLKISLQKRQKRLGRLSSKKRLKRFELGFLKIFHKQPLPNS